MKRPMIRFKQELTKAECDEVLKRNTAGVMAVMGDEGYPYAVPLSYIYHDGKIYFHCGKKGYKIDCMNADSKVCFTVIDKDEIIAEEYTTYFRSVIATGNARVAEGQEKFDAFLAMTEKYSGVLPEEMRRKEVAECTQALLYAIDIKEMTGKEARELAEAKQA